MDEVEVEGGEEGEGVVEEGFEWGAEELIVVVLQKTEKCWIVAFGRRKVSNRHDFGG